MKQKLIALALTATCLIPLRLAAQDYGDVDDKPKAEKAVELNNSVTLGAGYLASNAKELAYFGRFSGLTDKGAFGIFGFSINKRDWKSPDASYYSVEGRDLGLDSRSFDLAYGRQGSWGVALSYDGIPYVQSTTFKTIYTPSGNGTLNGATPSATLWYNSAALAPFLNTQDLKLQRDIFAAKFKFELAPNWNVSSAFRHEHKEGSLEDALMFGTGKSIAAQGGPAPTSQQGNILYIPFPVNYDTERFDASLAYHGQQLQGQISYMLSSFIDNNLSFNAIDPFLSPSNAAGNANNLGPAGTLIQGAYSTPPSNSAHEIKLSSLYTISPNFRIAGNFAYGLMLQDSPYPAATLNAYTLKNIPYSYPASLNGKIETWFGNVAVTGRLLPELDVKATYTADHRDNNTLKQLIQAPYVDSVRNYFTNIGAGAVNGVPNFIFSTAIDKYGAEAAYRLFKDTKVTLGYQYKETDRTMSDVLHSTEATYQARVNNHFSNTFSGSASYEYSERRGSYNGLTPWTYLGYTANENKPLAYFEAPRNHEESKVRLSYSPAPELSLDLQGKYVTNTYPISLYGLTKDGATSVGPDIGWAVSQALSLHAYYTFERITRTLEQNVSATLGDWTGRTKDTNNTVGLNGEWLGLERRLKLTAGYTYSKGDVLYTLGDSPAAMAVAADAIIQLPRVKSELQTLSLHGDYQLAVGGSVLLGYTYERFANADFGLAALANPLQYGNVILSGDVNPTYSAHIFSLAYRYKF